MANLDTASKKQEHTSKPEPVTTSSKPDKPSVHPTSKPDKPSKPQVEQANTDTVVWRPAQFRTNKLYSEHAYGKTNGRRFIVAQEGDTWGSIAYMLGMEEKTLRRINEATDKQTLSGGDRIYLFPKRSKADKKHSKHLVQPGETAWSIAQLYGMRMRTLYKLNGIEEGTPLKTHQWLVLR